MAFTNFGTGLAAVAQGMAYTPNWGQEQQAMIQMGQTIQQYYAQKQAIAKENYEITQTVLPDNEADAAEYNVFAKQRLIDMEAYRRNNPNYLTDPDKYSEYRRLGKELQDNAITRRAISFKTQKDTYAKHLAEDPKFATSHDGKLQKEKIDFRAKYGQAAYNTRYGEEDYQFIAPVMVDVDKEAKEFMSKYSKKVIERKDATGKYNQIIEKQEAPDEIQLQKDAKEFLDANLQDIRDINAERNNGKAESEKESEIQTSMNILKQHLSQNEDYKGSLKLNDSQDVANSIAWSKLLFEKEKYKNANEVKKYTTEAIKAGNTVNNPWLLPAFKFGAYLPDSKGKPTTDRYIAEPVFNIVRNDGSEVNIKYAEFEKRGIKIFAPKETGATLTPITGGTFNLSSTLQLQLPPKTTRKKDSDPPTPYEKAIAYLNQPLLNLSELVSKTGQLMSVTIKKPGLTKAAIESSVDPAYAEQMKNKVQYQGGMPQSGNRIVLTFAQILAANPGWAGEDDELIEQYESTGKYTITR